MHLDSVFQGLRHTSWYLLHDGWVLSWGTKACLLTCLMPGLGWLLTIVDQILIQDLSSWLGCFIAWRPQGYWTYIIAWALNMSVFSDQQRNTAFMTQSWKSYRITFTVLCCLKPTQYNGRRIALVLNGEVPKLHGGKVCGAADMVAIFWKCNLP